MYGAESMKERLLPLYAIANPAHRRAVFLGILSEEVERRSTRRPFVVGGMAVELYTLGGYQTGDLDIKGPHESIDAVLREMGFEREGNNNYALPELDLYVHWLGEGPEPPFESLERATDVRVDDRLFLRVIGWEDIIIDRLNAAKHWKDEDSLLWAQTMIEAAISGSAELDLDYLRERAKEEDVLDILERLLVKAKDI